MSDRTLILMRHAKSSWANASLSDFDRPLNARGRKAVPVIADWLEENSKVPDCILCSTALRAQQTAELVSSNWQLPHAKIDLHELYLASPETILKAIQDHGPLESKALMVVGHNPGFEVLASTLAGRDLEMPTAAIAIFRLRSSKSWSIEFPGLDIELEEYIVPRQINPSIDPD